MIEVILDKFLMKNKVGFSKFNWLLQKLRIEL